MPDSDALKPGTTEVSTAGGSATASGTTADASTGGSQGETAEQKSARLEAELETEKNARRQLLSEKTSVEERARQVEERERRLAATPPTAGTTIDPRLASLNEIEAMDRDYPGNPIIKGLLEVKRDTLRNEFYQQALIKLDQDLLAHPAALREDMRRLMISGETRSLDAALAVSRDRANAGAAAETERIRKENEELQRDMKAMKDGRVGTGGRPAFEPQRSGQVMKRSEYESKVDGLERAARAGDGAKKKEALQLLNDVTSHAIRLVDG